jgi:hypothetical protein
MRFIIDARRRNAGLPVHGYTYSRTNLRQIGLDPALFASDYQRVLV